MSDVILQKARACRDDEELFAMLAAEGFKLKRLRSDVHLEAAIDRCLMEINGFTQEQIESVLLQSHYADRSATYGTRLKVARGNYGLSKKAQRIVFEMTKAARERRLSNLKKN